MSEQKNRHHIFDVVIQKSNNLRRRISQFHTKEGHSIGIGVHSDQKEIWCSITDYGTEKKRDYKDFWFFFQSGRCVTYLHDVSPENAKEYSAEETLKNEELKIELDTLVQWLEDPNTVRVNPYHPEIILTEEEEDIDRYFDSVTKALDKYRIDLALTPLKPGINKVRESTISFDWKEGEMIDTLESLSVKEPISLGSFGSIFWSESCLSGKGDPEDWRSFEDFLKFCNQDWEQHYALPYGGDFALTLKLNKPLRDSGFESVSIRADYLMSTISSNFTSDGERVSIERLTLPKELTLCLKDILLDLKGEELFCHYCCLPKEGNPMEVDIEFIGCHELTMKPDDLLGYVATRLSQALCVN